MSKRAIGGYFGWEFPHTKYPFPHQNEILVNSCRSALQLIVQSNNTIKRIYLPYFTCKSVYDALKSIDIDIEFYHITRNLELEQTINLTPNDFLLYTNYFGIKDEYCKILALRYGHQLIIDNAQALYAPHIKGTNSVYSFRKFIGVPDGGVAKSDSNLNNNHLSQSAWERCNALLARAEDNISLGYNYFLENEKKFSIDGIKKISTISKRILSSFDHETIIQRRRNNFSFIHNILGGVFQSHPKTHSCAQ